MDIVKKNKSKELGRSVTLRELYPIYFPGVQEPAIAMWRSKKYYGRRFPPAILGKLEPLKKEGINYPDWFEVVDAPMLIGEDEPELLTPEKVREIIEEKTNNKLLEKLAKLMQENIEQQKINNQLLRKIVEEG